jgi:hypothetical protein
MKTTTKTLLSFLISISATAAFAGAHTWDVWEIFSNADGTIQFVELRETNGTSGEIGIGGHPVIANPSGRTVTIPGNVPSPTTNKSYLIATPAFAALPGVPTPNAIVPVGTVPWILSTDISMTYSPYDTATWTAGTLPTDGVHSLQRPGVGQALAVATNSPTNYAGTTGSIDVSAAAALPGVPDGSVTLAKLAPDGSSVQLTWNTAACSGELDHQVIYGDRSGFPATPGGNFTPLGGACNLGTTSPATWNATPDAGDGSGLIWFLVVPENNANVEGPWGKYNAVNERNGPGTNGASNVCGVTDRLISNACGH